MRVVWEHDELVFGCWEFLADASISSLLVRTVSQDVVGMRGSLAPLSTAVPWGDSPRVQGGPWVPPPCGDESSETLLVVCLVFVRSLWDGCLDILMVLLVSGVGIFVWSGDL